MYRKHKSHKSQINKYNLQYVKITIQYINVYKKQVPIHNSLEKIEVYNKC